MNVTQPNTHFFTYCRLAWQFSLLSFFSGKIPEVHLPNSVIKRIDRQANNKGKHSIAIEHLFLITASSSPRYKLSLLFQLTI